MPHEPTEVDQPETVREKELAIKVDELERRLRELEGQNDFGLTWEHLPEDVERRLANEVPVLVEAPTLAVDGAVPSELPHLLIEGDNLHALHTLQATHKGRVDVIYIDPPYNTGKEFIYNDKLIDEENTFRHSAWLSFMEKRLRLAKDLLTDTGVIIISIDDNEFAQLKLLCDSVFGEANFLGNVIRATNSTKSNSKYLSINYDYTYFYARNKTVLDAHTKEHGKWEVEKNNIREYKAIISRLQKAGVSDEELTVELKEQTNYPRFVDFVNYWYVDGRGVYRKGDLGGVQNGNMTPLRNPLTGKLDPVPPGGFRRSPEGLQELIDDDRIHFHTDGSLPTIKRYLDENPKQRPKGLMSDDQRPDANMLTAMGISFDNPKQLKFMRRILSIFSPDALFLDFFAGSGTTLHAVASLNGDDGGSRQCILVTNNENNICQEVTLPRINALLSGQWADGAHDPLPGSLRFFRTDFIARRKNLDTMRTDIAKHTVDLVAVKESTAARKKVDAGLAVLHGDGKSVAVLTDLFPDHAEACAAAMKRAREGDERIAYVFTWSDHGVEEEVVQTWDGWRVSPLPAQLLAALRRTAPTDELPLDFGGEPS